VRGKGRGGLSLHHPSGREKPPSHLISETSERKKELTSFTRRRILFSHLNACRRDSRTFVLGSGGGKREGEKEGSCRHHLLHFKGRREGKGGEHGPFTRRKGVLVSSCSCHQGEGGEKKWEGGITKAAADLRERRSNEILNNTPLM